jgi:hypothetical protein
LAWTRGSNLKNNFAWNGNGNKYNGWNHILMKIKESITAGIL